ncbi:MAG: HK97 family phage prohead protease [Pseudomonadota bacterium]
MNGSHQKRRHQVPFSLKAAPDVGVFSGYAAVFNLLDEGGDVIAPGSFQNSIKSLAGKSLPLLWQHQPHEPIGNILSLKEDHHGLYVKARLALSLARAREATHLRSLEVKTCRRRNNI